MLSRFLVLCTYLLSASIANADDFDAAPFPLRALLALNRASGYAGTDGRQASVAFLGGSSINPAADDFGRTGKKAGPANATITGISTFSDSGGQVVTFAGSFSYMSADRGTWPTSYAYTDTLDGKNNDGLETEIQSHELFLGYSTAISNTWAIGVQTRLVSGFIRNQSLVPEAGFQPLQSDTDILGLDVYLGAIGKVSDTYTLGITATASISDTETEVTNLSQLGPLLPGNTLEEFDETAIGWSVVGGFGYTPSQSIGIYSDLQYVGLHTGKQGTIDLGRLSVGTDIRISTSSIIRVGTTVDTRSEWSPSVGLGIRLPGSMQIDFAYEKNGAPEVNKELGKTDILSASLAVRF